MIQRLPALLSGSLALLVLALLSGNANAQFTIGDWSADQPWTFSSPGSGAAKAIAGDFTGDGFPDMVLMREGAVGLAEPSVDGLSLSPLPFAADDLCAHGGHVVTVDSLGVHRHLLLGGGSTSSTVLEASSWAGARAVHAIDLDGLGLLDLVGIDATGAQVLKLVHDGASWTAGTFASGFGQITQLCVLDFETAGAPCVALLTDLGLAVLRTDTSLVTAVHASTGPVGICAISQTGQRDRLGWIVNDGSGQQYFAILSIGGWEEIEPLGDVGARSITAFDLDQDGDDEVAMTFASTTDVRVFLNARSAQAPNVRAFPSAVAGGENAGGTGVWILPGPAAFAAGTPSIACVDFDQNGANDIATSFATEQQATVRLFFGSN